MSDDDQGAPPSPAAVTVPADVGPLVRDEVRSVLGEVPDALDALDGAHGPDAEWLVLPRASLGNGSRVAESLLTVADGVIGTRGSLEEDGSASTPATVAAGVYEVAAGTGQELLVVPSWSELRLHRQVDPGQRMLDLRTGVLWRTVPGATGALLRSARWACLGRPGVEVLVAEGESDILGPDQGPPLAVVERRSSLGSGVVGLVETATAVERAASTGQDDVGSLRQADAGRTFVRRIATYGAGAHRLPRSDHVSVHHYDARRSGTRRLFDEQRAAWTDRWLHSDVEVAGDRELTLALRTSLFHIAASVASHGEAALGARGLSGTAYAGHVFWDADVFVLPVLAATHPASARAMLEYRIRRLPRARRAAAAIGRTGARFPWESAADGRDVTPTSGVDELGREVPIRTGAFEEHITADVAWAAWHLASVTGSWRLLEGPARGLLVDTARYWACRVHLDRRGRGHIDHVIGPDEYHEDVDDNTYTNVMAAWNLRRGAEVLERTEHGSAAEAARWRALADALVTGYDPRRGHHVQFTGFDDLEPLLASDVGPVPVAGDLVLGHERVAGSQVIKQADAVMLHHLVPGEMPPGSRERDLDWYLPRTVHGSSLSPSVYAAVLARSGRVQEAAELLDIARKIDLEDLTGTTAGGLHMAAMGGLWQAVVHGFAGVHAARPDDAAFVLDPHLPGHWGELRVALAWHGHELTLRCRNDAVHVACSRPIEIVAGTGSPVTVLPPGGWVEVARPTATAGSRITGARAEAGIATAVGEGPAASLAAVEEED